MCCVEGRANGAFTNEAEEDDEVWLESSSCPINYVQNKDKAHRRERRAGTPS